MNRYGLAVLVMLAVCSPVWAKRPEGTPGRSQSQAAREKSAHGRSDADVGQQTEMHTTDSSIGNRPPGLIKENKIPRGLEKRGKTPAGWSRGNKTGWNKTTSSSQGQGKSH